MFIQCTTYAIYAHVLAGSDECVSVYEFKKIV